MTMPETSTPIGGGCYCGTVRWRLVAPDGPASLPVRVCQCSFCLKHGAQYTSDPHATLELHVSTYKLVQRYRFGHGTADFIFCRECGTLIAALMDGPGCTERAVLNINTADKPETFSTPPRATDFDTERREERLARRSESWIGHVIWMSEPRA